MGQTESTRGASEIRNSTKGVKYFIFLEGYLVPWVLVDTYDIKLAVPGIVSMRESGCFSYNLFILEDLWAAEWSAVNEPRILLLRNR